MVRKLSKRLNSKRLKSKSLSKRLKSKRLSKRKKMSIQKGGDPSPDIYLIALGGGEPGGEPTAAQAQPWAIASPGQVASIKEYTTELSKEGKEVNGNMIRTIYYDSAIYDQIRIGDIWHLIHKVEPPTGFDVILTKYATNTLEDDVPFPS